MKRFLLALLCAGLALCAVGCGGNGETDAGQIAPSSQAESDAGPAASPAPAESGESVAGDSDAASIELRALAGREPDHTQEDTTYGLLVNDGTSCSEFDASAGDIITVEVENTAGSLDITIQRDDETLYDQKNIQEESCVLEVDADGHCVVTVVGHMASGHYAVKQYAMNEEA